MIKNILKKSKLICYLYSSFRRRKREKEKNQRLKFSGGGYINRSTGSKYLCVVLAGYKDFLWPQVFSRLKMFAMQGMDVCIASSGKYLEELVTICATNNWSYLWSKQNNVSLIQNIAIKLHSNARYIFKLDEDIFITKDYFTHMISAYEHAWQSDYTPGVVAPIIPINGYGHIRVLEKLGLYEYYEKNFERPKYRADGQRMIENNEDVAKLFWGEGDIVPSIDELNDRFWRDSLKEIPCPIRFSIGAILFERDLWESMGYFKIDGNLGRDEEGLCAFCCLASRPVMVSENIVVGHLSFRSQNDAMKEYYSEHIDKFSLRCF